MSEFGSKGVRAAEPRQLAQYVVGFCVAGTLMYFAGIPLFLLFFVGVLTIFILKVFSSEGRGGARKIFEFYLLANEILRADNRRWFGFELVDAIERGESIIASMPSAPPLLHFTLGALYQKIGRQISAEQYLSKALEGPESDEMSFVQPTRELADYARMLRRIEASPGAAPLTSAAVRSLERLRRTRGHALLDRARQSPEIDLSRDVEQIQVFDGGAENVSSRDISLDKPNTQIQSVTRTTRPRKLSRHDKGTNGDARPTISEVLHDIYDGKT